VFWVSSSIIIDLLLFMVARQQPSQLRKAGSQLPKLVHLAMDFDALMRMSVA